MLRDQLRREIEFFRIQKERNRFFPMPLGNKRAGYLGLFGGYGIFPDLGPKAAPQEITKKRMEPVFFRTESVPRRGKKDVVLCEHRQHRRATQIGEQRTAVVQWHRFEKRKMQQKVLSRLRFPGEDL